MAASASAASAASAEKVAALEAANRDLMARLLAMEKRFPKNDSPANNGENVTVPARRSPRRSTRRSPGVQKSPQKRPSPEVIDVTPKVKKRLSYTKKLSSQKKKRTPKPKHKQTVRQVLGALIKSQFDAKILDGGFLTNRKFNLDEYEDAVRPIIDSLHAGDEVDTSGLTKHEMFRMAVSIAKKRERYTPVPKDQKKQSASKVIITSTQTLTTLTLLNTKNNLKNKLDKIRAH